MISDAALDQIYGGCPTGPCSPDGTLGCKAASDSGCAENTIPNSGTPPQRICAGVKVSSCQEAQKRCNNQTGDSCTNVDDENCLSDQTVTLCKYLSDDGGITTQCKYDTAHSFTRSCHELPNGPNTKKSCGLG
jgi:hypothetical protein